MRARAAAAAGGGGAYEAEGSEEENETPAFGKSDCRKYKYIACGTPRGCIWVGNVGCRWPDDRFRAGSVELWRRAADVATWRYGGMEAWKHGGMELRRLDTCVATWRYGLEARCRCSDVKGSSYIN